jgi:hypothetical protein
MLRSRIVVLLSALFVLTTASAFGQPACFLGDDGFNIGCCAPPNPNLPQLPPIQMQASYACINNCNPANVIVVPVSVTAPQYFLCDYAIANVSFTFPGGATLAGPLLMKYARTWMEPGAAGIGRQVWRFLVNGDLQLQQPGIAGTVCPIPPCASPPTSLPVHWDGNIDYACDPTSAVLFQALLSLSHMPGCLSHAPFSAYPAAGAAAHTNISYHLVGPAPFAFVPIAEPQGPLNGEDLRSSIFSLNPFVYQCRGEAPLQQGSLTTQFTNCLCSPLLPIVGPWKHQALAGSVCCVGAVWPFASIPLPGTVLPTGFAAQTLGMFGGAAGGFPGIRELTFYVGVIQYADPCNAASVFNFHVVTGVGTSRHPGQMFVSPIAGCGPALAPFATNWIDLQNMLILVNLPPGGNPLPGIGGLFASRLVFNLNIP